MYINVVVLFPNNTQNCREIYTALFQYVRQPRLLKCRASAATELLDAAQILISTIFFFVITQVRLGLSIRASFLFVHISSLSAAWSVKKSKFVSDYLQPKDHDTVNACTSLRACGDNFSTVRRSLDFSKKMWIESKNTAKRTALKLMLFQKFGRSFCHLI